WDSDDCSSCPHSPRSRDKRPSTTRDASMKETSPRWPRLRNDLLRGIHAEPWDFGEALHCLMMLGEEVGHLLIELAEVVLDQSQFVQRQLQEPAIHRIQRRACPEGVGQLSARRAEAL